MGLNYEKHKEWLHTQNGRASTLLNAYNTMDKKHNRGKGDLTPKWIVENIFTKPCAHCGIEGWNVIGCNRINNDLPHTKDNVEPCCKECNDMLHKKEIEKIVYQYKDDELIAKWSSAKEAAKQLGFSQGNIWACCNGLRKTHKGFRWSCEPLKPS